MVGRGCHAIVLAYSAFEPSSLERLVNGWKTLSTSGTDDTAKRVVAATMCDKTCAVPISEGKAFATLADCALFETSAKTGRGIDQMFKQVISDVVAKNAQSQNADDSDGGSLFHLCDCVIC